MWDYFRNFHTVRVLDTKNANNFSTHHIWVVAGMAGIVFSLEVLNAYIHHHAVEMLFGRRKNMVEFQTVFRNFDLYLLNAKVYVKSCAFPSIILFFLLLQ